MPSDAAFREALDAVVQEAFEVGKAHGRRDTVRMGELATRVLALYAERQGEVYEARVGDTYGPGAELDSYIRLPYLKYPHGCKVRVARVECWRDTAGRAHPKEGQ